MNQLAQINNPALSNTLQQTLRSNNPGATFLSRLLPNLVTIFLIIGSVVFVFILILGAIQWITSGGDKASVEGARSKVTHALIGLVILFSVFAIVTLVSTLFGIQILTIDIGPLNL